MLQRRVPTLGQDLPRFDTFEEFATAVLQSVTKRSLPSRDHLVWIRSENQWCVYRPEKKAFSFCFSRKFNEILHWTYSDCVRPMSIPFYFSSSLFFVKTVCLDGHNLATRCNFSALTNSCFDSREHLEENTTVARICILVIGILFF